MHPYLVPIDTCKWFIICKSRYRSGLMVPSHCMGTKTGTVSSIFMRNYAHYNMAGNNTGKGTGDHHLWYQRAHFSRFPPFNTPFPVLQCVQYFAFPLPVLPPVPFPSPCSGNMPLVAIFTQSESIMIPNVYFEKHHFTTRNPAVCLFVLQMEFFLANLIISPNISIILID